MIWVMPNKTLSARTQFAYSGGENPVWTKELNNMLVLGMEREKRKRERMCERESVFVRTVVV